MKEVTKEFMVTVPVYLGELYVETPGIENAFQGYIPYIVREKDGKYYAQDVFQYIHTNGNPDQINSQLDEGGYPMLYDDSQPNSSTIDAPVIFKQLNGQVVGGNYLSDTPLTEAELHDFIANANVPMYERYNLMYGNNPKQTQKRLKRCRG